MIRQTSTLQNLLRLETGYYTFVKMIGGRFAHPWLNALLLGLFKKFPRYVSSLSPFANLQASSVVWCTGVSSAAQTWFLVCSVASKRNWGQAYRQPQKATAHAGTCLRLRFVLLVFITSFRASFPLSDPSIKFFKQLFRSWIMRRWDRPPFSCL